MNDESTSEDQLSVFVDKIIAESELNDLDPESKEEAKKDLGDKAEEHIHAAILASLPPEKLEEFSDLLNQGDQLAVQEFCRANVPDLTEVTALALINFRQAYLGY